MKNGQELVIVMFNLFVFGIAYNELIARLEKARHDRGYTAFLVVGGVLITLVGLWFLEGLTVFLIALALFVASGLPMVIGSMIRSSKMRTEDEEKAKQLARELLDDEEKSGRVRIPSGADASDERQ